MLAGHQHGGRKPRETSVAEFWYKSMNLFLEELINIKVILFLIHFLISVSLVTDLFYYKYGTFSLQLFVINLKPSTHHLPRLALLFAGGVIFVYLM